MENPVDKAREAINALGTPAHDEANTWLTEFEITPEAWNVAQALVQDPPGSNNRFYGANIFYNKIRRDYIQLKASAHDLKAALMQLLSTLAQENPIDSTVSRRVSLALAALALQLNEPNVVSDILVQLSPVLSHVPQVLLDLLMVLPEECYNNHIDVDYDQRDQFSEQLSASAPQVLDFLCTFTTDCTGSTDTQQQMLKCFSRWIEHTTIGQDILAEHTLIKFTITALRSRDLFDEAVDVMIGLFRQFGGQSCLEYNMALPAVLVPRVLELTQLWNQDEVASNSHDDDVCRGLSRLMTEMLESYLYIITMSHDIGQTQLLDQLIICAQYPWDFDVARIPLKGFYELSAMLRNNSQGGGRERFGSYYAKLLEIVIRQSRITEKVLMGAEDEDNYVRSELNESIIDVIDVIGAEPSLQIVLGMLEQCHSADESADKYISVEACLNGVEVVAHFLGADDHSSSNQLMAFLTTLPSHLPGLVRVRNKIIASFSNYLGSHSEYLPNLMELASTGLLNQHTSATSAHTLMCLFKFCPAVQESLEIPTFYAQICQLREKGELAVKPEVDILTGLSHILSEMDVASCEGALEHLIEPIISAISHNIAHHSNNQKDIMDHVDRITAVMSNTRCRRSALTADVQHPVLSVFLKLLPTFRMLLEAYSSEVVCEKVCRCYKHVMRNTQEYFFPFLEAMADHVTHEFQTKPFASFIYVSSICVSIFGESLPSSYVDNSGQRMIANMNVNQMKTVLLKQYSGVTSIFFSKCSSIESFEEFPDLVEEFFYFSARFVQTLPEEFLSFSESVNVLQAAVSGLSLRHREAQKGILLFFERFVDLPKQMHELSSSPHAGSNCVNLTSVCQDLLLKCMPSLVSAIFVSLSGAVPAYAIDENYGSIADVLWRLKKMCPVEFNDCLNGSFGGLHEIAQEHALAMNLGDALMKAEHMRRFSQLLELFQRKCKRGTGK